jgi:hypothetical protein
LLRVGAFSTEVKHLKLRLLYQSYHPTKVDHLEMNLYWNVKFRLCVEACFYKEYRIAERPIQNAIFFLMFHLFGIRGGDRIFL